MSGFKQFAGAVPFSQFQMGGTTKRRSNKRSPRRSTKRTQRRSKRRSLKRRTITRVARNARRKPTRRVRRRSTRKDNRRSKKRTIQRKVKVLGGVCNCDDKRKYKGTEPSPKGLGYCAHCTPLNITMKGADGNLWENQEYKKGKRWVMVRNDMSGGS